MEGSAAATLIFLSPLTDSDTFFARTLIQWRQRRAHCPAIGRKGVDLRAAISLDVGGVGGDAGCLRGPGPGRV